MADDAARIEPTLPGVTAPSFSTSDGRPDPTIRIARAETYLDLATISAIFFLILLISMAVFMGNANAQFFDVPSVMIVILGTIAVTCMSYTGRELRLAAPTIAGALLRGVYNPGNVARELLDIAVLSRKRGVLQLTTIVTELKNHPFMFDTLQMVTDGMTAPEIDRLAHQEIDVVTEQYRKAAGMLRRASEIAPAMGLIGTLIGLVQMLASLDDPATIGPAMALALLTTFYGAVLGSAILGPLAAKLERNAHEDTMVKSLIQTAAIAMVTQENPRKLEMELNSLLPAEQRIKYFDF